MSHPIRSPRWFACVAAAALVAGLATSAQASGGEQGHATTGSTASTAKVNGALAKAKPSMAELAAKNAAVLAWYAGHGIEVPTVVKDGIAWAAPTAEQQLRAAEIKAGRARP